MKTPKLIFLSRLAFVTFICLFYQNTIAETDKDTTCRKPNNSSKCSSSFKSKYKKNKKKPPAKRPVQEKPRILINNIGNATIAIGKDNTASTGSITITNSTGWSLNSKSYTSVYDYLSKPGNEKPGYGLYSYVLFPHYSPRTLLFLEEFFKTIGSANKSTLSPKNLNLIYIPIQSDKPKPSDLKLPIKTDSILSVSLSIENIYDYAMARGLLVKICQEPADIVRGICETDLSGGPYLFTYTSPASAPSPMSPPYLFVDLSNVHVRAFGEFIAAYKAQIKRTDYTDLKRIDNLRLRVLNIVLTAADLINPMKDAIADILYMAKGKKENNSNQNTASKSPKPKDVQMGGTSD